MKRTAGALQSPRTRRLAPAKRIRPAPAALVASVLALFGTLAWPDLAHAYIGPGAGFAFVSSFLVLFTTILLAFVSLLLWPFRTLLRIIRRRPRAEPKVRRFVVVGLDGQDPRLTDRFMQEGKLPNFAKLAERGCYKPLTTTFPSVSPVAWSSFATGTHPARHDIFDFLDRDPRTYLPELSSTKIGSVDRFLSLGRFRIPLEKPELRLLRKSKPFWSILGEHNVWSTVLRVPITFPPDRFYGAQLSAMCAPDLLGTQGTFLLFTTRTSGDDFKEGGMRVHLARDGGGAGGPAGEVAVGDVAAAVEASGAAGDGGPAGVAGSAGSNGFKGVLRGDTVEATLEGPENLFLDGSPPLSLPLRVDLDRQARRARVRVGKEEVEVAHGELSDWVHLTFPAAPGVKVRGITRLMVTEMDEHFSLYMTPISLDPEKPAMPISHPDYYAIYLAKKIGPYSALGLAEDTWALNEGVIDDGTFLKMTHDIDDERQDMFFAALDRLREGVLVCVFDATDRIQHMFWRYLEDGHPAARGVEDPEHADAIEQLYRRNDELVGRVMEEIDDERDLLMVVSDHGFSSFRRGVNLNRWLYENGYLALQEGADGSTEWLRDVDWSRTRAYCLGLTGMYLNLAGREAEGVVEPGKEAEALKRELIERLGDLRDEEEDEVAIVEAFDTSELYGGPYLGNAPDLLIGYNAGYRTSWDCATGMVSGPVFEDNVKAWSGDHCIDPRQVPGVLFCNRDIDVDDPALIDIAPTALQQFGLRPPHFMDGRPLFADGEEGMEAAEVES